MVPGDVGGVRCVGRSCCTVRNPRREPYRGQAAKGFLHKLQGTTPSNEFAAVLGGVSGLRERHCPRLRAAGTEWLRRFDPRKLEQASKRHAKLRDPRLNQLGKS